MVQLVPLPSQNPIISCLTEIQIFLPFWYRLTQVVLEKRPLNGCGSTSSSSIDIKIILSQTIHHRHYTTARTTPWYTKQTSRLLNY